MTIYEIRERTRATAPYFFSPDSMRFFGQTMKSFSVKQQPDGRYMIKARMVDKTNGNAFMGYTVRYFNPINNKLEFE